MFSRTLVCVLAIAVAVGTATSRAPQPLVTSKTDVPSDARIILHWEGVTITIVADGRVLVEGQTFDFDLGAIEMRISREQLRRLIDHFEGINFLSLRDQYRDQTDRCSRHRLAEVAIMQTTSFTLNGKSKSVTRHPYECLEDDGSPYPRDLVALEKQIADVINLHKR